MTRIKQTTEGQLAGLIMDIDLPKRLQAENDRLRAELAAKDSVIANLNERSAQYEGEAEALRKQCLELAQEAEKFAEQKQARLLAENRADDLADKCETLRKLVAELEGQLPDEMKHCTIQFKECEKGHGWLTATNWVQHGCPTCRAEQAEKRVVELERQLGERETELNGMDQDIWDERAEWIMGTTLDGLSIGPTNRQSVKSLLAEHFAEIGARAEQAEAQITQALGARDDAYHDRADMRNRAEQAEKRVAELEVERDSLKDKLDEANAAAEQWGHNAEANNTRAEQAEAQLANITKQNDVLRQVHHEAEVELAEAKLHMEKSGMYGNAGRYWEGRWRDEHAGAAALLTQLAEAKLDIDRLKMRMCDGDAAFTQCEVRAERAEAERDAMRFNLNHILSLIDRGLMPSDQTKREARDALDPSPAGREG